MQEKALRAEPRMVTGKKVKNLRTQGLLPAVMYGAGIEPIPIELDAKELTRMISHVGASTLIDLSIGDETHTVLVRDVQRHPILRDLLHVDFLKVAMDVVIRTQVPVELVGEAPGVREMGGVLVTGINEIEVEALPSDLPDHVTVDLEILKEIEDTITVGDLFLGKGVKVLEDSDEMIAKIIYQVEEEEEVEEVLVEEEEEPEIIERGKREGEAEEGEAGEE